MRPPDEAVGLVAKNGILIVEFANKLQLQRPAKQDAVREAAMTRLRPKLMTTAPPSQATFR